MRAGQVLAAGVTLFLTRVPMRARARMNRYPAARVNFARASSEKFPRAEELIFPRAGLEKVPRGKS